MVKHPALRRGNLWITWNRVYFQLPPLGDINFKERGTWKPLRDELNSSIRRVKEDLQTVTLYHKGGSPEGKSLLRAWQTNVTIANLLYMAALSGNSLMK
jgi:hypothetical protein